MGGAARLREVLAAVSSERPAGWAECVGWARRKFDHYFRNRLLQLLTSYRTSHAARV